ncbi:MAG: hypothetical protein Q4D73_01105 [Actinomycetaceae bacterium]|nr:hypothetical protein [Actinomycetaceae bacterium]
MKQRFSAEDGRITVLVIGLTLLVLAIIAVSIVITSLHTQRRQLYACADAIALGTAQDIKGSDFYLAGEFHLLHADVQQVAKARLGTLQTSACNVGNQVVLTSVQVDGNDLEVTVETVPTLPIVSRYMSFLTEPMKIRVASIVSVAKSRSV